MQGSKLFFQDKNGMCPAQRRSRCPNTDCAYFKNWFRAYCIYAIAQLSAFL